MQSNSVRGPRGVQTEEIWAAADAVLALGERPTIERVRQQLGRGSPNTVGPMLDGWYGSLAGRLQSPADGGDTASQTDVALPAPVIRAAKALWGRAMQHADEQAAAQLKQERELLAGEAAALRSGQEELVQDRERLGERAEALALALQAKDAQITDLGRQIQELQQQLGLASESLENVRSENATLRHSIDAEHRLTAAKDIEHQAERTRLEERATSQERRLHAEVDRARQEAKRLAQQLESDAKKSAKALADALDRERDTGQQFGTVQAENATLTRELASSRGELNALQSRADDQSREMLNVLSELRDRLPASGEGQAAARPKARRKRT